MKMFHADGEGRCLEAEVVSRAPDEELFLHGTGAPAWSVALA